MSTASKYSGVVTVRYCGADVNSAVGIVITRIKKTLKKLTTVMSMDCSVLISTTLRYPLLNFAAPHGSNHQRDNKYNPRG